MALAAQLLKDVANRGPSPQRRGAVDAEPFGQFVGGLEADAPDVGGQAIGIFLHQLDGLVAVGLVDADGPGGADAVRLQEHHDAADGFLLLPAFADALDAARADALDLLQKRRAFVDDVEGAFAEDLDDLAGEVRADALDQTGAEILFDALHGVRRRGAQRRSALNCRPWSRSCAHSPVACEVFAGDDGRQVADDGDQPALSLDLDAQHGKAGVRVVKGDPFDDAG